MIPAVIPLVTPLVPALGGAMIVAGLIGAAVALRPVTAGEPPGAADALRASAPPRTLLPGRVGARLRRVSRRTQVATVVWVVAGVLLAVLTGWLVAILIAPAAVVGLPILLSRPPTAARISRLEAMEEWARGLSGVLVAGLGLDDALKRSLKSTPEAIRPEVKRLVSRLHAGMPTDRALRAFADDLDDATGDLIAANLILASARRGSGLAAVLNGLAASVGDDVRARRRIEADQAGPRSTARQVTLATVAVLGVLALTGEYIEPYGTPVGQVILLVLLTAYVATLVWLRSMATPAPLPRILGTRARQETQSATAPSARVPRTSTAGERMALARRRGHHSQAHWPKSNSGPRP